MKMGGGDTSHALVIRSPGVTSKEWGGVWDGNAEAKSRMDLRKSLGEISLVNRKKGHRANGSIQESDEG